MFVNLYSFVAEHGRCRSGLRLGVFAFLVVEPGHGILTAAGCHCPWNHGRIQPSLLPVVAAGAAVEEVLLPTGDAYRWS